MINSSHCYYIYNSYFRIKGRVQKFTFVRDEAFDLSEQREHALMALAEDNKMNKIICLSVEQF